jgi:hypothetical protein
VIFTLRWAVLPAIALLPVIGWADPGEETAPATEAATAVTAPFAGETALSAETLDAGRAGTALPAGVDMIQVNEQDLSANFTGNVATGNITGTNTIATGAFSDSSGFVTAIQNTGNNVLIQNATIVNVAITP